MKLFSIRIIICFLCIFSFINKAGSEDFVSYYKIEVGGVDIGTLRWDLLLKQNYYETSIFLENKGLLSGLYKYKGKYFSKGQIINEQLVSTQYQQLWETKKKRKEIKIEFKNSKINNFSSLPKEIEGPRVNFKKLVKLGDPLSSFLNILIYGKNKFKTIDGRRYYEMSADIETKQKNLLIKKIFISEYYNIWKDHNKNDLKYITTEQNILKNNDIFPRIIKIKNKRLTFKLTRL
tara:strand:- start:210 stop:911 length:702 start_codon:yes stop_codon:yes gene_type:complete